MRILAIDTSSRVLGAAVLEEGVREVEFNYNFELRHSSHLVPTIKKILSFSDLGLEAIDAYAVSIGPGSFTGLRIGVATVKALCLVHKKKVAAVSTFDVLAANVIETDDTIAVVIDAKKEKIYACFYEYKKDGLKRISGELLLGYDDLKKRFGKIKNDILLVGDGVEKLSVAGCQLSDKRKIRIASREFWQPRAINAARLGLSMLKSGRFVKDVDGLVPLYMHPHDIQCRKI